MSGLIVTLGTSAVLFAFGCSVGFMVIYTLLAKWWHTEIGWARISLDFGIAIALSPTVIHYLTGVRVDNSPAFAWYVIGSIFFVGLVSLWNLAIVVRMQLKRRQDGSQDA